MSSGGRRLRFPWLLATLILCFFGGISLWLSIGAAASDTAFSRQLLRASLGTRRLCAAGAGIDDAYAVVTRQVFAEPHSATLLQHANHAASLDLVAVASAQSGATSMASDDSRRLYAVYGAQTGWAAYVSEEFYHLFGHLSASYGWKTLPEAGRHETWEELAARCVASLGRQPDVLLFMESYEAIFISGNRSAMPHTALWLFMDDVHWFSAEQRASKARGILAADLVLGTYAYALDSFFPEAAGVVARAWVPHAASSIFQLPLRSSTDVTRAVLLSGATFAYAYPYRALVETKLRAGDTRFAQHEHPGYNAHPRKDVGRIFAGILNSHLACITDGLTFNYTVAKIFELPAAGCLLLINSEVASHLAPLGFVPGVHYLPYTASNLDDLVDAVLDERNSAAIDAIRAQGQALVWSRHTVTHRAALVHELANRQRSPATGWEWGRGAAGVQ